MIIVTIPATAILVASDSVITKVIKNAIKNTIRTIWHPLPFSLIIKRVFMVIYLLKCSNSICKKYHYDKLNLVAHSFIDK